MSTTSNTTIRFASTPAVIPQAFDNNTPDGAETSQSYEAKFFHFRQTLDPAVGATWIETIRARGMTAKARATKRTNAILTNGTALQTDSTAAVMRYISNQWDLLLADAQKLLSYVENELEIADADWEHFADHQVLAQSWFQTFSIYDDLRLAEGSWPVRGLPPVRGLQALATMPGYAEIEANLKGFVLVIEGTQRLPITAVQLAQLLTAADTGPMTLRPQTVPFTSFGVYPRIGWIGIRGDGITMVFTLQTISDILGTPVQTSAGVPFIRVSMETQVYNIMAAYGSDPAWKKLITTLLGKERLPENAVELEFINTNRWYGRASLPQRPGYFAIGRALAYLQEERNLRDFSKFAPLYAKRFVARQKRAAELAKQRAEQAKALQAAQYASSQLTTTAAKKGRKTASKQQPVAPAASAPARPQLTLVPPSSPSSSQKQEEGPLPSSTAEPFEAFPLDPEEEELFGIAF